jgi:hypothetical protein
LRSPQELFDLSVSSLRAQGQKSYIGTDLEYSCRYRGENDCKCAIGWLILDQEYKSEMEGLLIKDIFRYLNDERKNEFDKNLLLLTNLQNTHDRYPIPSWEKQWRMIATDYNLVYKGT